MHDIAVLVGEHLHLDVARVLQRALEQQPAVAERVLRLRACRIEGGARARSRPRHSRMPRPPPPAAALIISGKPIDAAAAISAALLWSSGSAPKMVGTPAVARDALRAGLVGHLPDRGRRRPDPGQSRIDHGLREIRVLGEEAIARMHRVGAGSAALPR